MSPHKSSDSMPTANEYNPGVAVARVAQLAVDLAQNLAVEA